MEGPALFFSKALPGQALVSRASTHNPAHNVCADDVLRHYPESQRRLIKYYWSGATGDVKYNYEMVRASPIYSNHW